jgi:hypothetical protein
MQLDREQTISIAALALLLVLCVLAVQLSVQARSDAVQEFAERREMIVRLEARSRTDGRPAAAAPAAAFLAAATQGLAGAQLQAHLAQVAGAEQVGLISSGIEPAKREDAPDTIRLSATMELGSGALQAILHRLETGAPYVFVEALTVQPAGTTTDRPAEDPLLRATLSVRAFWRRGSS